MLNHINELNTLKLAELKEIAQRKVIFNRHYMNKAQLVDAIKKDYIKKIKALTNRIISKKLYHYTDAIELLSNYKIDITILHTPEIEAYLNNNSNDYNAILNKLTEILL